MSALSAKAQPAPAGGAAPSAVDTLILTRFACSGAVLSTSTPKPRPVRRSKRRANSPATMPRRSRCGSTPRRPMPTNI